MVNIAHIINPVNVPESSDLHIAQPVTFRTMRKAKNDSSHSALIAQYVIGYEEDALMFPKDFISLPPLTKSVLDFGTFTKPRKLPLIADILEPLLQVDTDYIVYTNVDIALQPFFYDFIYEKITSGSDSLIINRRVVASLQDDASMFAEIGKPHPGYDCFVFRKELLSKFVFGNTCIGANFIGRILYANLLAFSNKLEIIKDAHLTFHIGDDGAWLLHNFSEYDRYNRTEVKKAINSLISITVSEEIKLELYAILKFMDNWNDELKKVVNKKPISNRIKARIKKIIKAFYQ